MSAMNFVLSPVRCVKPPKQRHVPIDTLVLAGGGVRGVAMLGAISRLQSAGVLSGVRTVVGTSAGALLGALVATRADLRGSLEIMCTHGYVPDFDFGRLFKEFGLDSGKSIDSMVTSLLPPDLTFGDVSDIHGMHLVVCATNLSTRTSEFFSADTHPDMPIALAIRMSCSIPLYFKAVHHEGSWYVDGSVTNNFACDWALRNGAKHVLGVTLKPRTASINSLDTFLGALVEASSFSHRDTGADVLELDAPGVSAVNFGAPRPLLLKLFASGAQQAAAYLKKRA
jgi:predicted acylesterase/phospholipase RssA